MVTAYTQLPAERYRGKLDENADKFIGYVTAGALRMQVLIKDLLAFSPLNQLGRHWNKRPENPLSTMRLISHDADCEPKKKSRICQIHTGTN